MKVLAIVHPLSLLAVELRQTLERHRDLWRELRLLSTVDEEVGSLTEVDAAAAMVGRADEDALRGVDVAFFCGPIERNRPLLAALPTSTAAIVLSPDAEPGDGHPVVADVNLESLEGATVPVSPHPGAVALAHLLHPLLPYAPRRLTATLLQPASVFGSEALDEVLDQTRAILRFEPATDRRCFQAQIAFNLLPATPAPLVGQLRAILDDAVPDLAAHLVQAAVFHSFAVAAYLELDDDPGADTVRAALAAHPAIELAASPEVLGPIDAAADDHILVGSVDPAPDSAGGYWIWAVMDNLTRGGALNALRILEAVLGRYAAN